MSKNKSLDSESILWMPLVSVPALEVLLRSFLPGDACFDPETVFDDDFGMDGEISVRSDKSSSAASLETELVPRRDSE